MGQQQALKEVMTELIKVAAETGTAERERLGRELTEAEAARLAAMIRRSFRTALAMVGG